MHRGAVSGDEGRRQYAAGTFPKREEAVRIVAIINQKGGCGKTTTAINLAGVLSRSGLRTLLVDMDPQSHCAAGLGVPEHRIDLDIGDALVALGTRSIDPARLLWRVARNLDLAPSRMKLAGLEASRGGLADKPDKERRLGGVLSQLSNDYDIALVDCSPAIGLLTFNALTAASAVLIPVETGYFSLQGAAKQVHTVTTVGKRLGVDVPLWLLPTIHDPESGLARDLLMEIRRRFAERVAPLVIRRDDRLREAASYGQPVIEYAPDSTGALDYTALGAWLTETLRIQATRAPAMTSEGEAEPDRAAVEELSEVRVLSRPGAGAELTRRILGQSPEVPAGADADSTDLPTIAHWPVPHATPRTERSPAPPPRGASIEPVGISRAEDLAMRAARIARHGQFAHSPTVTPESVGPDAARGVLVLDESPPPSAHPVEVKPVPVERVAGVRVTGQGVLFIQPASVGREVSIAGDFNGWSPDTHRLRRNESAGVFELCVRLAPGRHVYRLVVDGVWSADPFNDEFELNPFGEPNSVVRVTQR